MQPSKWTGESNEIEKAVTEIELEEMFGRDGLAEIRARMWGNVFRDILNRPNSLSEAIFLIVNELTPLDKKVIRQSNVDELMLVLGDNIIHFHIGPWVFGRPDHLPAFGGDNPEECAKAIIAGVRTEVRREEMREEAIRNMRNRPNSLSEAVSLIVSELTPPEKKSIRQSTIDELMAELGDDLIHVRLLLWVFPRSKRLPAFGGETLEECARAIVDGVKSAVETETAKEKAHPY